MVRQTDEDHGHPIEYDPDFNGPSKKRSCTDIICLFLFVTFIGCWAGIAIYAYTSGDPNTLLVPKDSAGGRCGLDDHVKDKPYLFFFDLTQCVKPNVPFTGCSTPQICVEKCPDQVFIWKKLNESTSNLICDYERQKILEGGGDISETTAQDWIDNHYCASWYLPSDSLLNRCLYNVAERKKLRGNVNANIKNEDEISNVKRHLHSYVKWLSLVVQNSIAIFTENESWQQFGQNLVDDLIKSWWKILVGVGIAVLTCIIYIMMMRWLASIMVWLSLIGVVVLLGAGTYYSAKKYIDLKDLKTIEDNDTSTNIVGDAKNLLEKKNTWLVLLIISSFLLFIVLLMLIFLRKRILLAIALVKEGSKAVGSVTSALFFPIFHWILQLSVIAFALSVALYLATTGKPLYRIANLASPINDASCSFQEKQECFPNLLKLQNSTDCYQKLLNASGICKFQYMQTTSLYPYLQAINAFGFLWGTFFVSALGQMILATVFATWYWTWNKKNLPFFAVTEATLQTLRYHIGTLAFGSLIITICRIIRIILEYIDQKLKKYDNELTKAILCCCKCFFWCLEKFLKFLNRNAYIMCAIHGKNFCCSAKDAFSLLMRNIIRVFVLDKVTDFLFFLGKLVITIGVGAISYVMFATDLTAIDNTGLNYNLGPVIVIMICTYIIATVFFDVYSMAVDTLFLCFLEDCERNDGSDQKPYFMSRNLMQIFGKKNKVD